MTNLFGHLHAQIRRLDLRAFLQQANIASGLHLVLQRPIDNLVSKDQGTCLAQFDIAFCLGGFVGPTLDMISRQK